jgi:integrase
LKKSKKEYKKVLPLTNKLQELLKEYIERFNIQDKLFNLSRSAFDKILKEAYKSCSFNLTGLKKVRYVENAEAVFKNIKGKKTLINHKYNFFYRMENKRIAAHILRHSFAFNFLEKNKTDQTALEKLRRILEHHSFDITKDYVHFKNEDLRSSMDKF